jgi:hypothetical protein
MTNFPHREIDLRVADLILSCIHHPMYGKPLTVCAATAGNRIPYVHRTGKKSKCRIPLLIAIVLLRLRKLLLCWCVMEENLEIWQRCAFLTSPLNPAAWHVFTVLKPLSKYSRLHRQTDRRTDRRTGGQTGGQTHTHTHTHIHTHIHPHQHIPTLHPTHVEAYVDTSFYFFVDKVKWINTWLKWRIGNRCVCWVRCSWYIECLLLWCDSFL